MDTKDLLSQISEPWSWPWPSSEPHAEICPVCLGIGKIEDKSCHGCSGSGWIVVR